jgi:hypothetical protein
VRECGELKLRGAIESCLARRRMGPKRRWFDRLLNARMKSISLGISWLRNIRYISGFHFLYTFASFINLVTLARSSRVLPNACTTSGRPAEDVLCGMLLRILLISTSTIQYVMRNDGFSIPEASVSRRLWESTHGRL